MDALRVLIADDHPIFRNGMRALPGPSVHGMGDPLWSPVFPYLSSDCIVSNNTSCGQGLVR
jgi:hypothetical protein